MKLYIKSGDTIHSPYILYTSTTKTEIDTFEDAKVAYNDSRELRFLYQPDKTYYLCTISASGSVVGDDHAYYRDTAKCYGLFISRSANQIEIFLNSIGWRHQGASKNLTKARMYVDNNRSNLLKVSSANSPDFEKFEYFLQHYYLKPSNINSYYLLENGYGAIDVKNYDSKMNPYYLY